MWPSKTDSRYSPRCPQRWQMNHAFRPTAYLRLGTLPPESVSAREVHRDLEVALLAILHQQCAESATDGARGIRPKRTLVPEHHLVEALGLELLRHVRGHAAVQRLHRVGRDLQRVGHRPRILDLAEVVVHHDVRGVRAALPQIHDLVGERRAEVARLSIYPIAIR